MVVEVSRVVSNLVNKRGDRFSQSIVLLQINREVGLGVCPDFSQPLCIFVTVSRNADNASSGRSQLVDLSAGGLHIPGVVAHMLWMTIGFPPPMERSPILIGRVTLLPGKGWGSVLDIFGLEASRGVWGWVGELDQF
jgi:hypothetical protein